MGNKGKVKSIQNKEMIIAALQIVYSYVHSHFTHDEVTIIQNELKEIVGEKYETLLKKSKNNEKYSYDQIQKLLSKINEKESIRKNKGVYYTPNDVVKFILINSIKSSYGKLTEKTINNIELSDVPYSSFCIKKTIFDPTCGAGEFLLTALEMKLTILKQHKDVISKNDIIKTVATINGNDVNRDSIIITELRLLLCVIEFFKVKYCTGIAKVMHQHFTSYDFVEENARPNMKYNIIVGNPPYVEDSKCGLVLTNKYGNIYANVLINAAKMIEKNGTIGFIIPLSYIATPRMKKLRSELVSYFSEQYILSFADRPDCLFDSVHQKLCILFAKEKKRPLTIYTGNYQYWYKEERDTLFQKIKVVKNKYLYEDFIPKLGTQTDIDIFKKVTNPSKTESVYKISRNGFESVYLNRRETFWIKAYRKKVEDPEYKIFSFTTSQEADFCYCLVNSSLFWWYWVCVSDCWHVSKTLNEFRTPLNTNTEAAVLLAKALMDKLEETKVFVGTKQTQFEYKHRDCLQEIYAIDDYINSLYGLTDLESEYIKSFAIRYRTSGGANTVESN